ncbi:MAG TPA: GTPase Era [Acidiferrobacteraceae bacterium]|nr:GTPase Era [Acidiferrobacteraceae bacterium]HEX19737.1 GTPase Era [Acidiferrobacteraceae bacterium]
MTEDFHSGLVTLIGRPNVGKSTLLNRLVGQKVSIISPRPQTTRHRILGISNSEGAQVIYIDTPGIHSAKQKAINRYMNKAARASLEGVDCIVMLIAANGWHAEDELVLKEIKKQNIPAILAINKIDKLHGRDSLLPLIDISISKQGFAEVIPLSAQSGENVDRLQQSILPYLPVQPALYPEEQFTDKSDRFLISELVREQVFLTIGQEIPYAVAVEIEKLEDTKKLLRIEAIIWVEKDGQKSIIIGKGGAQLKVIGSRARSEIERLYNKRVYLNVWVKVRKGWSGNEQHLRTLGYDLDIK